MIYFISDTHFNHDRSFVYGPRGFSSVADADETIIRNWNSTVGMGDDIYVLGDFFLGTDMNYIQNVLSSLNGRIHLILGNHDTPAKIQLYEQTPNIVEVVPAKLFNYGKRNFYLSHYPTLTANYNDSPKTAVYNLHGHTHDVRKFFNNNPYMYNVACDAQNNTPVSIDQIMMEIDEMLGVV
jgi:calcineurin-like phosphoesterase family protein